LNPKLEQVIQSIKRLGF